MNKIKRDKSRKSNKTSKQKRSSSKTTKESKAAKSTNNSPVKNIKTGKSEPATGVATEVINESPKPRQEKFDPVVAVMNKYIAAGWQAVRMPKNSINDFLAQKSKKLHFVQVVPEDKIDDNKYHGLSKNSFIQNAFSNSAAPIYAYVTVRQRKNTDGTLQCVKIILEDINSLNRVIVGGNRKKQLSTHE